MMWTGKDGVSFPKSSNRSLPDFGTKLFGPALIERKKTLERIARPAGRVAI
jgi:hypothetical protein